MLAHIREGRKGRIILEFKEDISKKAEIKVIHQPSQDQLDGLASLRLLGELAEEGWSSPQIKDYYRALTDTKGIYLYVNETRVYYYEFPFKSAPVTVVGTDLQKRIDAMVTGHQTGVTSYTTSHVKTCSHGQTLLYSDQDGIELYISKLFMVDDGELDLIVDLTGAPFPKKHRLPANLVNMTPLLRSVSDDTIYIDVPDYGIPEIQYEFWINLWEGYIKPNKLKVVFACAGGHGRSGMISSIFVAFATGMTGQQAIDYVRNLYCKEAVETATQEAYVRYIVGHFGEEWWTRTHKAKQLTEA